jgi:hypothetical protein
MSEPRKKSSATFWTVMFLGLLIVAYPLSAGPLQWLSSHGKLSEPVEEFLFAFYAPIRKLALTFDGINRIMRWYIDLWR